ncbi:hypothetical protein GIB67_037862 [Kingdonia uniflora]|uniref:Protein SMG7L n=1 Tax=Kingdonia uniflora TaxID=39325 RepID=A0A7J7LH97_9MAGN|nr:hypothetical protein GIB67_037862 [Kingdonia uniflora]
MYKIQDGIERVLSAPIMLNAFFPLNDQSHKPNSVFEAVNAEKLLRKLIASKGILHTDVQVFFRKARSSYEKSILNDHELAELQNIEYSLWKLHYKHIDEYRFRIRESLSGKQDSNSTALDRFTSFLSESIEFYQGLIAKIRSIYGIPKKIFSLNECDFPSSMNSSKIQRCKFSCHRCLVCIGDLARYKELYGNPDSRSRNWSIAATHYLKASEVWPDRGNPHNQLAVLATYVGDEFLALYHCIRSLAVQEPFPDAWDNLILLFEKVRSSHTPILLNRLSHLHYVSDEATFDFYKPHERSSSLSCYMKETTEDVLSGQSGLWSLIVWMLSFFYINPSLEGFLNFSCIFNSTIQELEALLSLDDITLKICLESYQCMEVAKPGPSRVLQLVSIFIFTIELLSENSNFNKPKHVECIQHPAFFVHEALVFAFIFMGRIVDRCVTANPVCHNPFLPAILVFVEWLVEILDRAEEASWTDKRCENAMSYFLNSLVDLLNQFDEIEDTDAIFLWEDQELLGFSPIIQSHTPLSFSACREPGNGFEDKHECEVRSSRIVSASMKIAKRKNGSSKWISYKEAERKFFMIESKKVEDANHLPLEEAEEKSNVLCNSEKNKHVYADSFLVDEEEVIVFKPLRRHNSAPVRGIQDQRSPRGPRCTNTFGNIPEDTVLDSFTNLTTVSPNFGNIETKYAAGPPSLSAWVLGRKDIGHFGEMNLKDSSKDYNNENAVNKQDLKVESSVSALCFMSDSSATTTHYEKPPYVHPVPSAPPLPDNATWFSHNDTPYIKLGDLKNMEDYFINTTRTNGYLNLISAQTSTSFDPHIRAQAQGHIWPARFATPTNLGRFQDQKSDATYHGYRKPSVYEQQLLLQYLKEKEWRLQLELQLRGHI